jgi:glycosyltransferase involved in cell wall biosynthesis
MTARGTDVNVIARMPAPGRRIVAAAAQASAVITVSRQLKDTLVSLGVEAAKVIELRNGVDLEMFDLEDQSTSRARLGLPATGLVAVCVGNLVPEKNHALAIAALTHLEHLRLIIVGEGPQRTELERTAQRLGVAPRVSFRAAMPQRDLRHLYASADVMLLTSTREGWPNVVLESMACGTPVVATDVGAVGAMISHAAVGRIVRNADAKLLAEAVRQQCEVAPRRAEIRRHAAQFGWTEISRAQWQIFTAATSAAGVSGEARMQGTQ